MSGIVCAVRGGPNSRPTIDRAVRLAQETGLDLHFLYVVNLDFLTHTTSTRVRTISQEMRQMGEFILASAQSKAETQGVAAQSDIRQGDVGEEIVNLCRELEANYLVMGRPQLGEEGSIFTQERLRSFIADTEEQTGAQVVLPEGETE
ncbi:MAG: universal stress protein [Anaerolineae bacterium]|jgi:nucleotide-binding universal stress UspA family protein